MVHCVSGYINIYIKFLLGFVPISKSAELEHVNSVGVFFSRKKTFFSRNTAGASLKQVCALI